MRAFRQHRRSLVMIGVAVAMIGGWGTYRYWNSYYQHRGFAQVAFPPHAPRGRVRTIHFYSVSLRRRADYIVGLPPGYGSGVRYPVYYLLHGSPGRPDVYLGIANLPARMDNLISQRRMRPMILVFPDGRIGGSVFSDSEWANTRAGAYASYVLDVVADVDRRFATLANRDDRVIAGYSAGAYGASNIALHHLGTFANLQAWSGYYVQTRTGVFKHAGAAALAANSPLRYVSRLRARLHVEPMRALLLSGRKDHYSRQTRSMADALAAAGASVSYALYPGGHDWELWHAHLNQLLVLASQVTRRPPSRADAGIRNLTAAR